MSIKQNLLGFGIIPFHQPIALTSLGAPPLGERVYPSFPPRLTHRHLSGDSIHRVLLRRRTSTLRATYIFAPRSRNYPADTQRVSPSAPPTASGWPALPLPRTSPMPWSFRSASIGNSIFLLPNLAASFLLLFCIRWERVIDYNDNLLFCIHGKRVIDSNDRCNI